jgi:uncharacterized iron-regulated protein
MINLRMSVATGAFRHLAIVLTLALGCAPLPASIAHAQTDCSQTSRADASLAAWEAASGSNALMGTILAHGQLLAAGAASCSQTPIAQLRQAMTAHLADGGVLLLGEVHDNGAQHALRAALINDLAAALMQRRRPAPALVFEHLRTNQAQALATPHAGTDAREAAQDLMKRVEWDKSGWPAASLFLPIIEAAFANKLPILPGHPLQAEVRDVSMRGLQALPAETVTRLRLEQPLPDPLQNALLDELEASHCGLMPRTAFTNMAFAQRYRDAHLAASLEAAAAQYGSAILLAGNGHVRSDRAVPWDLARLAPGRKTMTVMLIETEDGQTDAASYVPRDPSGKPAVDYVVLTPRAERPDPCEAMRARFKKK